MGQVVDGDHGDLVQLQVGFALIQNGDGLDHIGHVDVSCNLGIDQTLQCAGAADQVEAGAGEAEGDSGGSHTLTLSKQAGTVGQEGIVLIGGIKTIGLIDTNGACILRTVSLDFVNHSGPGVFGGEDTGGKVGLVVDDGSGDDIQLTPDNVAVFFVCLLGEPNRIEHTLNLIDDLGGLELNLAIDNAEIAVLCGEGFRTGILHNVAQIGTCGVLDEADQLSVVLFTHYVVCQNIHLNGLAIVDNDLVGGQNVFRCLTTHIPADAEADVGPGVVLFFCADDTSGLGAGLLEDVIAGSGFLVCILGRFGHGNTGLDCVGAGGGLNRVVCVDVIQVELCGNMGSCLDLLGVDGQVGVQVQADDNGITNVDTVLPGDNLAFTVDGVTLVVNQIEADGGGGAAPGNTGDGEDLLGVVAVDIHVLQNCFFVGVVDILGTITFHGAFQVGVEGQGNFLIGDVADGPDELLLAGGSFLGVGEVLGADGDIAIGIGGQDVHTCADDIGVGLKIVVDNSEGDGFDVLRNAGALAGQILAVNNGASGMQIIGLDGDGRRSLQCDGVTILVVDIILHLDGEILVDNIGDLGVGTGIADIMCQIDVELIQSSAVVSGEHLAAVGTGQVSQDRSQNRLTEGEVTEGTVCQVETNAGNGIHTGNLHNLFSSIERVALDPGDPVCVAHVAAGRNVVTVGGILPESPVAGKAVAVKVLSGGGDGVLSIEIKCVVVEITGASGLVVQLVVVVRSAVSHEQDIDLTTAVVVLGTIVFSFILGFQLGNGSSGFIEGVVIVGTALRLTGILAVNRHGVTSAVITGNGVGIDHILGSQGIGVAGEDRCSCVEVAGVVVAIGISVRVVAAEDNEGNGIGIFGFVFILTQQNVDKTVGSSLQVLPLGGFSRCGANVLFACLPCHGVGDIGNQDHVNTLDNGDTGHIQLNTGDTGAVELLGFVGSGLVDTDSTVVGVFGGFVHVGLRQLGEVNDDVDDNAADLFAVVFDVNDPVTAGAHIAGAEDQLGSGNDLLAAVLIDDDVLNVGVIGSNIKSGGDGAVAGQIGTDHSQILHLDGDIQCDGGCQFFAVNLGQGCGDDGGTLCSAGDGAAIHGCVVVAGGPGDLAVIQIHFPTVQGDGCVQKGAFAGLEVDRIPVNGEGDRRTQSGVGLPVQIYTGGISSSAPAAAGIAQIVIVTKDTGVVIVDVVCAVVTIGEGQGSAGGGQQGAAGTHVDITVAVFDSTAGGAAEDPGDVGVIGDGDLAVGDGDLGTGTGVGIVVGQSIAATAASAHDQIFLTSVDAVGIQGIHIGTHQVAVAGDRHVLGDDHVDFAHLLAIEHNRAVRVGAGLIDVVAADTQTGGIGGDAAALVGVLHGQGAEVGESALDEGELGGADEGTAGNIVILNGDGEGCSLVLVLNGDSLLAGLIGVIGDGEALGHGVGGAIAVGGDDLHTAEVRCLMYTSGDGGSFDSNAGQLHISDGDRDGHGDAIVGHSGITDSGQGCGDVGGTFAHSSDRTVVGNGCDTLVGGIPGDGVVGGGIASNSHSRNQNLSVLYLQFGRAGSHGEDNLGAHVATGQLIEVDIGLVSAASPSTIIVAQIIVTARTSIAVNPIRTIGLVADSQVAAIFIQGQRTITGIHIAAIVADGAAGGVAELPGDVGIVLDRDGIDIIIVAAGADDGHRSAVNRTVFVGQRRTGAGVAVGAGVDNQIILISGDTVGIQRVNLAANKITLNRVAGFRNRGNLIGGVVYGFSFTLCRKRVHGQQAEYHDEAQNQADYSFDSFHKITSLNSFK